MRRTRVRVMHASPAKLERNIARRRLGRRSQEEAAHSLSQDRLGWTLNPSRWPTPHDMGRSYFAILLGFKTPCRPRTNGRRVRVMKGETLSRKPP